MTNNLITRQTEYYFNRRKELDELQKPSRIKDILQRDAQDGIKELLSEEKIDTKPVIKSKEEFFQEYL